MKRNVVIFHGTGGYPEENWFPWIKNKLEERGCNVYIPQFPNPKDHLLPDWLSVLEGYIGYINETCILIGHSLGGIFLLRVLERLKTPVYGAFIVASPIGIKPIRNWESDSSFSGFDFNWNNILRKAKHFKVYHSDNDPYVSLGNGEELARKLEIQLTLIPNAGHFNTKSGYTKFKYLLKDIEEIL